MTFLNSFDIGIAVIRYSNTVVPTYVYSYIFLNWYSVRLISSLLNVILYYFILIVLIK